MENPRFPQFCIIFCVKSKLDSFFVYVLTKFGFWNTVLSYRNFLLMLIGKYISFELQSNLEMQIKAVLAFESVLFPRSDISKDIFGCL